MILGTGEARTIAVGSGVLIALVAVTRVVTVGATVGATRVSADWQAVLIPIKLAIIMNKRVIFTSDMFADELCILKTTFKAVFSFMLFCGSTTATQPPRSKQRQWPTSLTRFALRATPTVSRRCPLPHMWRPARSSEVTDRSSVSERSWSAPMP